MEPEERRRGFTKLLEFGEHTAAGRMTTEFIAVSAKRDVVNDAIDALRLRSRAGRVARGHDLPDRYRARRCLAPCHMVKIAIGVAFLAATLGS